MGGSPLCAASSLAGLNHFGMCPVGMGSAGFVCPGQLCPTNGLPLPAFVHTAFPNLDASMSQMVLAPMAFSCAGGGAPSSVESCRPGSQPASQMMLAPIAETGVPSAQKIAHADSISSVALPLSQMLPIPQACEQDTGTLCTGSAGATRHVVHQLEEIDLASAPASQYKLRTLPKAKSHAKKGNVPNPSSEGPKAVFVDLSKLRPGNASTRGTIVPPRNKMST